MYTRGFFIKSSQKLLLFGSTADGRRLSKKLAVKKASTQSCWGILLWNIIDNFNSVRCLCLIPQWAKWKIILFLWIHPLHHRGKKLVIIQVFHNIEFVDEIIKLRQKMASMLIYPSVCIVLYPYKLSLILSIFCILCQIKVDSFLKITA